MIDPPVVSDLPLRILLAIDLSSRGDRALDRTAQLAHEWGAQVHVVHAVDTLAPTVPAGANAEIYLRHRPDPKSEALRRMTRLIGDRPARIHVEEGSAARAILSVAEREGCDFIVLGESRDRLLGPLETTVDQVVRTTSASVLVVRNRPAGRYRKLLVGTDFTDESLQALRKSTQLFRGADIKLIHAYVVPYAGLLGDTPSDQGWSIQQLAKLKAHLRAAELSTEQRRAIRLQVEAGPPAAVLKREITDGDADLTVIGAHPRGVLYDAILGNSRVIVDAIPGDVLVVRAIRRLTG